jgi:hypothetical protein
MSAPQEHDRYQWSVTVISIEEAQEVLDLLTGLGHYEIFSLHTIQQDGIPKLVITARQSDETTKRLTAQAEQIGGLEYIAHVYAPFDANYTSSCGHLKSTPFAKGDLMRCPQCKAPGGWKVTSLTRIIRP